MRRLKMLRTSMNYTQQDVADAVQKTQQTVARWESGAAEPSISDLRDMAVLFHCSVDDILGTNPFANTEKLDPMPLVGEDGFWGNLGLKLDASSPMKWYPISAAQRSELYDELCNAEEGDFITVFTLNNRALLINPAALNQITLLDEAADAHPDWVLTRDDYSGLPLELYRGFEALLEYEHDDETWDGFSESLQRTVVEVGQKFGLMAGVSVPEKFDELVGAPDRHTPDPPNLASFLHDTRIHFIDGTTSAYRANPEKIDMLFFSAQVGGVDHFVDLAQYYGEFESIVASRRVMLFDAPLIHLIDARKEANADVEADAEA